MENEIIALVGAGRPVANRLIFVTVSGLLATDGSELASPVEFYFSTTFTPYYSNVMRVRLIAGEFLTELPDDTIAQLIHFFSKQADILNYSPEVASEIPSNYRSYQARWVTNATIISLVSGSSMNADMAKRLGDLSVKRSGAAQELLRKLRAEQEELTEYLKDGGNFGKEIDTDTRSRLHPDYTIIGREIALADVYAKDAIPGANARALFARGTDRRSIRWKRTWR